MKTKIALASSVMLVAMFALAPNTAAALPVSAISHGSETAAGDHTLVQNVHWWRRPWAYGYYGPYAYYRPYAYYYRPYVYHRPYYFYAPYYYYRRAYCPRYYRYY